MNQVQIGGLVRDLIKAIGAFFVAKGIIDAGTLEMLLGIAMAGFGVAWSYYTNRTDVMISNVASSDRVAKVVTTPEIANADPSPKVVSKA